MKFNSVGGMQHQHKFAARPVAISVLPRCEFARGQHCDFFKLFGQLTSHGQLALAQAGQRRRQGLNAMRRFQQHNGARFRG